MFVFIILWVRAGPSWMSFPLPRNFLLYDTRGASSFQNSVSYELE